MKCSNCGAEIKNNSKFCEFCGSQISVEMKKEQEQLNKAGCPKCGSSNVTFDREVQGEVKGKKGNAVVRSTVGVCKDCGYTWTTNEEKKKGKTWLWVLGWIFIFPLPLTILLLRKKNMKPALKYGIIAVAWLFYIIIVAAAGGDDAETQTTDTKSSVSITDVAKQDDKTDVTKSVEDNKTSEPEVEKSIEITIDSNVNSDDGTVLFGITAELPEDTKLTVTLSNSNGFSVSDTVTILKNGKGYTSEFDENGKGLNGDYVVTVTDKDGNTLATKDFYFSYVTVDDVKDALDSLVDSLSGGSQSDEDDSATIGQKNALKSAKNYLSFTAFSYEGLKEQLTFEGYSDDECTYAADKCGADWNEQAIKSAKNYLSFTAFSKSGLQKQLEFEKFTSEQAKYGAENCGADWNEQAAKSAKNYLDMMAFSKEGLIEQLVFDGFTSEQAKYGAEANGY